LSRVSSVSSRSSRVVRARFEGGVLRPLEPLELEEGEEVVVFIRRRRVRDVLDKYVGLFGRASAEELERYEEEAQAQ
jgi:predicted DNA-binding antitoxin AbrB/MazE fold protein